MRASEKSQLLFSFIGDDFSGSSATAEALTEARVPTVIFTIPPSAAFLKEYFPNIKAVGVASMARTMTSRELGVILPTIFETIKSYGAQIFLYKVCSTFDSSNDIGNIGRAIEIGKEIFLPEIVPVIPAAPKFGRYTVFGHHFAALGQGSIYRLDRHPSMGQHPVTPMRESDLRLHLAGQTTLRSGLITVLDIDQGADHARAVLEGLISEDTPIVFFDCLSEQHLEQVCEMIWERAIDKPAFIVGSQEVGYGFGRIWQRMGEIKSSPGLDKEFHLSSKGPLLVLSGSCASLNEKQIVLAIEHGFCEIEVKPHLLLDLAKHATEKPRIIDAILRALQEGKSAIIHTAKGPNDPRITLMKEKASEIGISYSGANELLGDILGEIGLNVLRKSKIKRMVVAGGDTSGRVQKHFDIQALQVAGSSGIGVPLCYAYSNNPEINGLEIAFKGGQAGGLDYFIDTRDLQTIDFSDAALGSFPVGL